jgi:hypothetical protein
MLKIKLSTKCSILKDNGKNLQSTNCYFFTFVVKNTIKIYPTPDNFEYLQVMNPAYNHNQHQHYSNSPQQQPQHQSCNYKVHVQQQKQQQRAATTTRSQQYAQYPAT